MQQEYLHLRKSGPISCQGFQIISLNRKCKSFYTFKDHSTTYSAYLPDFDWKNDQLIMDYRSSDRLNVVQSTFRPCNAEGCGGDFDLTKFGTTDQELVILRSKV